MTNRIVKEPLNKSAAALSGSFAPAYRFENLEIHKVFLRFPNLNLEQNPSLTALVIESEVPQIKNETVPAANGSASASFFALAATQQTPPGLE